MIVPWGSIVNAAAVIAGSAAGLLAGSRYPESVRKIVMDAVGLVSIYLGISMSLKTADPLIMIFSLLIGGIIGHAAGFQRLTDRLSQKKSGGFYSGDFFEGLLTAFLIFCMGSMTIVGAIQEGINGKADLILAKSLLDGFTSIALASAFGRGVLFSSVPLLLFQGGLTVAASLAGDALSPGIISNLTGTGGILILGLALKILNIRDIAIIDYIPSLFLAVLFTIVF